MEREGLGCCGSYESSPTKMLGISDLVGGVHEADLIE